MNPSPCHLAFDKLKDKAKLPHGRAGHTNCKSLWAYAEAHPGAFGVELTKEDLARLKSAHPDFCGTCAKAGSKHKSCNKGTLRATLRVGARGAPRT